MQKVIHLSVPKPEKGRRFAISDVHGCSKTFKALLKKIGLQKEDQLFLLGDMVNRGPNSHKVLNRITKLKAKGYQLYYLRGNHEQMILNTIERSTGQRKRFLRAYKSQNLLSNGKLMKPYQQLLEDSMHFIDTHDYYLVHAGFNFKVEKPFEHAYSMLHIRVFSANRKNLGARKLVIGHQPKTLSEIKKQIRKDKRKIFIDNGCINSKIEGLGNLIALDLDCLKIEVQRNIDA